MTHAEAQAAERRRRALRSAASRRANRPPFRFPWQHVIDTVTSTSRLSDSRQTFLRRVRDLGDSCPPRALLEALRIVNDHLDRQPRPGKQVIRGVIASRKTVVMPWGDRERDVWTIDTDNKMNLYGTVPPALGHLRVGDRVEFWCVVQPGCYKYWRPKA